MLPLIIKKTCFTQCCACANAGVYLNCANHTAHGPRGCHQLQASQPRPSTSISHPNPTSIPTSTSTSYFTSISTPTSTSITSYPTSYPTSTSTAASTSYSASISTPTSTCTSTSCCPSGG
jgi:hypothetical protein